MLKPTIALLLITTLAMPAWAQSQANKTGVGTTAGVDTEREYQPFGLTGTQLGIAAGAAALIAAGIAVVAATEDKGSAAASTTTTSTATGTQ